MSAILGPWYYESDGDVGHHTHYAIRESADSPVGIERLDFASAKAAREFVARSNGLVFRLMNGRPA